MNAITDIQEPLRQLLDKEAIRTVLSSYCRGVDRRDWDLVRSTFHPDAYDDHGSFKGTRDDLLQWLERRHGQGIEQSLHTLGQCQIDFLDRDTAVAETHCRVTQRYTAEAHETRSMWGDGEAIDAEARIVVEIPCRYVDRLERRNGVWAIARRTLVIEDLQIAKVKRLSLAPEWTIAQRDRTDTLWKELGPS
jgi:hypothetical protein